jgi:hypothetical protein
MIDLSPNSSTIEELIGRPAPPPLRIHHIMVATAVVALLLAISHSLRQSNAYGFANVAASGQGIIMAIVSGLAVTLVGLGIVWRRRGYSFFDQPSHWLLLAQSLTAGFFIMAGVVTAARLPDGHVVSAAVFSGFIVLINALVIGLNLWAASKIADSIPWTLIFLIDGLLVLSIFGMAWLGLGGLVPVVVWGAPSLTLTLLLLAAWGDRRDHIRRDWPHWFGVCLRFVSGLQFLGRPVWAWIASFLTE